MKFNPKLIECLFGHHSYSDELVQVKGGQFIHLCKICGRSGYVGVDEYGCECWYDYDEEGNCIHIRWGDGEERWYNEEGACVRVRCSDGADWHFDESRL